MINVNNQSIEYGIHGALSTTTSGNEQANLKDDDSSSRNTKEVKT